MPPLNDDPTGLLQQIKAGLYDESNNKLIEEVRDALRGQSEPTVRTSIAQMQAAIVAELKELQGLIRRDGEIGTGGGQHVDTGHVLKQTLEPILKELRDTFGEIKDAVESLEERGHGGGGGGGRSEPRYLYEKRLEISAFKAATDIVDGFGSATNRASLVLGKFGELMVQQNSAIGKDFIASALNAGLHLTNFGNAVRHLYQTISHEIQGAQTSGVMGSNALTASEWFIEGPTRLARGILTTTDSFRTTLQTVQDSLQQGLVSPVALFGKTVPQIAADMQRFRTELRQRGAETRGWLQTEEAQKLFVDLVSWERRMGISGEQGIQQAYQIGTAQTAYMKEIAARTGETVAKLNEQLNAARKEQEILVGMGRLTPEQSQSMASGRNVMRGVIGEDLTKSLFDEMYRLLARGNDLLQIQTNPQTSAETREQIAKFPELYSALIHLKDVLAAPLREGETTKQHTEAILDAVAALRKSTNDIRNIGAATGMNNPQLQDALTKGSAGFYAQAWAAANAAAGRATPTKEVEQNAKDNPAWVLIGTVKEWMTQQAAAFTGLTSAMGYLTNAIIALAAGSALKGVWGIGKTALGIGGGAAAATGAEAAGLTGTAMLGAVARPLIRGAGALTGGAIGAFDAYQSGAPTSGIIGGGVGGAAGGWGGAAMGAALGTAIAPGIGTAIGAVLGGLLGSYAGGKAGTAVGTALDPTKAAATAIPPGVNAAQIDAVQKQMAVQAATPPGVQPITAPITETTISTMVQVITGRLDEQIKIQGNILTAVTTWTQTAPATMVPRTITSQPFDITEIAGGITNRLDEQIRLQGGMLSAITALPASITPTNTDMTPPVPVIQNVAGPQTVLPAAPAAGVADYQDQVLLALSQIIGTGENGNAVLLQVYGELTRQTGLLAAEAGDAGIGGYSGIGLSAGVSSVAKTGRPDHSTPYSGPGM